MATTISNLSNSTNLDGLLRKVYLPTLVNVTYNDSSFLGLIEKTSELISGGGNHIVHQVFSQRAEGVGTIAEGGDFVTNVPIKGKQVTENVKLLNTYIELTNSVITAANEGKKAAVNVIQRSFSSNIVAFKNNMNRMMMGDSRGILATYDTTNAGLSSGIVQVTNPTFIASQYLPPGTLVSAANFDSSGVVGGAFVDLDGSATTKMQVSALASDNLESNTSKVQFLNTDGTSINLSGGAHTLGTTTLVKVTAYDTGLLWANRLEPNGISNLVSDGLLNSETTTPFKNVWETDRTATATAFLKSLVEDINAELDESVLLGILLRMTNGRLASPNLLLTSADAKLKYFDNTIPADRRFNNVGVFEFIGGMKRTGITLDDRTLMLTALSSVPRDTIFMLNTSDFKIAQNAGFTWILGDGGNILQQSHTKDTRFAAARQEMNLVCMDPLRQFKGFGVIV